MAKQQIKKIDFQRLRRLEETSLKNFGRYLWALPREMMDSLSTGLGTGQTALTLAGVGVATVATTTGALTVLGSVVMGVAGGVSGVIAITIGVLSMVRQFKKSQKEVQDTLQASIALKNKLAFLAYNCDQLNDADLTTLVLGLDGIAGDSLMDKLCNLYGTASATKEELQKKMLETLQAASMVDDGMQATTLEILSDANLSARLSAGIRRLNDVHKTQIESVQSDVLALLGDLKLNPSKYTDIYTRHSTNAAIIGDIEARNRLKTLLDAIANQPGINFKQKIASLFRVEQIESLNASQDNDLFDKFELLQAAAYKEIECQYFDLLASHNANESAETFYNRFNLKFKGMLSFVEGNTYNSKIRKLLNANTFQSTATVFKARAESYPSGDKKVENLIAAKKIIDERESTTAEKVIDHAETIFTGFLGGMTGFGIVIGIAAVVGISIGTGGIGLGILVAALAATVIGVAITLWVRKKSKENVDSFSKNINDTVSVIDECKTEASALLSKANTNKKAAEIQADLAARDQANLENSNRLDAIAEENKMLRLRAEANERALHEANARIAKISHAEQELTELKAARLQIKQSATEHQTVKTEINAQNTQAAAHLEIEKTEVHVQHPATAQIEKAEVHEQTQATARLEKAEAQVQPAAGSPDAHRHLSPPDSPKPVESEEETHHDNHDHKLSQFVSHNGGLLGRTAIHSSTALAAAAIKKKENDESGDDDSDGDAEAVHEKIIKEI